MKYTKNSRAFFLIFSHNYIMSVEDKRLLRLEDERRVDPSELSIWVHTKKYGITEAKRPWADFEAQANPQKGYKVEVPKSVVNICTEIARLGGRALLVGGCVRDAVIAQELGESVSSKDFDIEVYGLSSADLQRILITNFGKVQKEGEAFEILKVPVVDSQEPLDVSIPRRESKKRWR